jgi:hypothetical protein
MPFQPSNTSHESLEGGAANLHINFSTFPFPQNDFLASNLNANFEVKRKKEVEVAQLFVISRTRVIKLNANFPSAGFVSKRRNFYLRPCRGAKRKNFKTFSVFYANSALN